MLMYGLVDCNNCYVSCERIFQPKYRNRPVIVLSNNDGCAVSRSNEAKALGIKMGAPAFELKDLIKQHDVVVLSSNYTLYADMSNRVMTILKTFTPDVEIYSIDEAFLKFKGFEEHFDLEIIGKNIVKTLWKGLEMPVSVGFAPTKALAKVANKIAKKFAEKTGSSYVIDTEEKRIKALKWTKIEDVWGIGRQNSKRLRSIGVTNAYEFTQLNDSYVRKFFTVVGLRLKKDLEGVATIQDEDIKAKKNIACTRSFDKMIADLENLKERVSTFTATAAVKLRNQNSNCEMIHVFILSNQFRQDLPQYNGGYTVKMPFPTSSTFEMNKWAQIALKTIFKEGYQYKKAGIMLMGITKDETQQLHLFQYENPKEKVLMKVIDKINLKMGERVKFGRNDLKRKWKMNQNMLTPAYTTRFSELINVKAI